MAYVYILPRFFNYIGVSSQRMYSSQSNKLDLERS